MSISVIILPYALAVKVYYKQIIKYHCLISYILKFHFKVTIVCYINIFETVVICHGCLNYQFIVEDIISLSDSYWNRLLKEV